MKYKYALLVAVVATTVTLTALAQKQALHFPFRLWPSGGKMYLLKAGGETVAELRVRGAAIVAVEAANSSSQAEYNASTGRMVATGGAILKLTAGTNSISVRADEIESMPDSK